MSVDYRNILTMSFNACQDMHIQLLSNNPLKCDYKKPVHVYEGIGLPIIGDIKYGGKLPSSFRNEVLRYVKKSGKEKHEVISHILITNDDKTIIYNMPSRVRHYKGIKEIERTEAPSYNIPANVHTLIKIIATYEYDDANSWHNRQVISSAKYDTTIFSNDPRFK